MRSWLALNLALLYLIHLAGCYPHLRHQWESRQVEFDAVADDYDYTIAGGGQSGLVVANCLSENNTDSVVMIGYGDFDNRSEQIDPSSINPFPPRDLFNLSYVPLEGLGGSIQRVFFSLVS
ncbi:putative Glucose-methanol-choline oxidoreductase N-terminal domain-containing protein [Seiridium cardinale]